LRYRWDGCALAQTTPAGAAAAAGLYLASPMVNVPDHITLKQLCKKAAEALVRAGLDRRIDIYREVEIDDPAVRLMLGRAHRVRVRVKITAVSVLPEAAADAPASRDAGATTAPEVLMDALEFDLHVEKTPPR
jgi:hypothetical protein